jgi:serine/threonine-protein kinase
MDMDKGWSLALVGGVVGGLVALGVAGLLLWQGRQTPVEQRANVNTPASPQATRQPAGAGGARVATPTAVNSNQEQEAIALIKSLYQALSEKDWDQARLAYTPAMQNQFDPAFFAQFVRVTVQDLRVIQSSSGQWQFVGRNTYFYPNGDTQEEERSYTVIWQNRQPLISDSQFLRVTKPR